MTDCNVCCTKTIKRSLRPFYTAFGKKNIKALEEYIHTDIEFLSPLAKRYGKKDYLEAAQTFASFFNTLTIRVLFSEENQVIAIYDAECPALTGNMRTAALITFTESLISNVELFLMRLPFVSSHPL